MSKRIIRAREIIKYPFQLFLGDAQSACPARREKGE